MMAFKPGTISAQEFVDRKGQCTSTHVALLVASPQFRKHQSKKQSSAGQGSVILVTLTLLLMFAILLAELLRPVGGTALCFECFFTLFTLITAPSSFRKFHVWINLQATTAPDSVVVSQQEGSLLEVAPGLEQTTEDLQLLPVNTEHFPNALLVKQDQGSSLQVSCYCHNVTTIGSAKMGLDCAPRQNVMCFNNSSTMITRLLMPGVSQAAQSAFSRARRTVAEIPGLFSCHSLVTRHAFRSADLLSSQPQGM